MQENNYDTLLVDVYNMYYRSFKSSEEEKIKVGKDTLEVNGIIRFLDLMKHYKAKYGTKGVQIYYLFDNSKSSVEKFRKCLSEDYKKLRKKESESFYRGLDMLELILRYHNNNCFIYRMKFCEADDYVKNIVESLSQENKVLMLSTDSDWMRYLNDNIHQYTTNNEIMTKEKFFDKYKYEATYSNICLNKVIYGDTTDGVKATIPTLPNIYFLEIIKNYDNIAKFIGDIKKKTDNLKFLDDGWKNKILKEEETLLLNWNLVESAEISDTNLKSHCYKCEYKKSKLEIIYSSLHLLGKVDTERFQRKKEKEIDLFELFSNGEDMGRVR